MHTSKHVEEYEPLSTKNGIYSAIDQHKEKLFLNSERADTFKAYFDWPVKDLEWSKDSRSVEQENGLMKSLLASAYCIDLVYKKADVRSGMQMRGWMCSMPMEEEP